MEFTNVSETKPDDSETKPEENETRLYRICAEYKKSTYQTEQWNNLLKNGKKVRFEVTTYFRWGNFEIELNNKEKEEILKKESIVLNDYCCSCEELWDGSHRYEEIVNEDNYTEEEKKEIHKLIYYDDDDDNEYDSDEDYCLDEDILEKNDWSMDDTIYGINSTCVLENIDIEG